MPSTPKVTEPRDVPRGDRLVQARMRLRMTQRAAAEALGLTPTSLMKWEKGEPVPEDRLLALADLYGASPGWLRYGGEPIEGFWEGAFTALSRVDEAVAAIRQQFAEEVSEMARRKAQATQRATGE